jgi:hypothetical protein
MYLFKFKAEKQKAFSEHHQNQHYRISMVRADASYSLLFFVATIPLLLELYYA